jgi:hypothetical protein
MCWVVELISRKLHFQLEHSVLVLHCGKVCTSLETARTHSKHCHAVHFTDVEAQAAHSYLEVQNKKNMIIPLEYTRPTTCLLPKIEGIPYHDGYSCTNCAYYCRQHNSMVQHQKLHPLEMRDQYKTTTVQKISCERNAPYFGVQG